MELASGNVTDRPWGATLAQIWRRQLTGRLLLRSGDDNIAILFRRGTIVGVLAANAGTEDVARRAARTFALTRGTFAIDDEQPQNTYDNVDTRAVIFFGARFVLTNAQLAADLRSFGARFKMTVSELDLAHYGISATDPAIALLKRGAAITDLDHNGRAIAYALVCCGACAIEAGPDAAVTGLAVGTERGPSLAPPLVAPPRRVPTPPFGVRIVTEKSRVPTPPEGVPIPVPTAATRRKVITQLQERAARRVDHFELLGVPFDAPADVVRSAYLALARQIQGAPSEPTPRMFTQLVTAFSVLSDPQRRAAYMATLQPIEEKQVVADASTLEVARASFAAGEAALTAGQLPEAIDALCKAVELDGENADYRATLAWARFLAADDKEAIADITRRVLSGAVPQSKDPAVPVFYLACVARDLNRDREAMRLFQRVLHLNPEHAEARREVRTLHERGDKRGLLDRFRR